MKIEEMVEEINKVCKNSCNITHFIKWELHSYGKGSLFSLPKDLVTANSFKSLVKKAYKKVEEKRRKENNINEEA